VTNLLANATSTAERAIGGVGPTSTLALWEEGKDDIPSKN
jgi:hypothetical protein